LIKKHLNKESTQSFKRLYKHTYDCQLLEMKMYIPAGIIFNVAAFLLIFYKPEVFIGNYYHVILGLLQCIFLGVFLFDFIKNFKERSKLLSECTK
jgi:hypothetical protein